mgnify:CR=1 FL=1
MRLLLALMLVLVVPTAAYAQSCSSLRAQLASAKSGGGGGGANLADLRRQARAFGCNSSSRFGQHRSCAGILAKIARGGGGRVDRGKVRRLQRQINQRCNQRTRQATRGQAAKSSRRGELPPQRLGRRTSNERIIFGTRPDNKLDGRSNRGGLFGGLFGNRTRTVRLDPNSRAPRGLERVTIDEQELRRSAVSSRGSGTLATRGRRSGSRLRVGGSRTVCVRLCDGFYFPINAASHSDNFFDEHAMCVGRCPGADVSLYVHSAGAPVETMRSTMTGESYVRLPTAFDYRKKRVEGCGCRPASVIAEPLDADKALELVGIGSEKPTGGVTTLTASATTTTVTTTTDATERKPRKPRLKAVYNGTGEVLPVFKTDSRPANIALVREVKPLRPMSREEREAAHAASLATAFPDVRDVGPVFLPGTDADEAGTVAVEPTLTAAPAPASPGPFPTSGAVSVIPLPSNTVAEPVDDEFNDASGTGVVAPVDDEYDDASATSAVTPDNEG